MAVRKLNNNLNVIDKI